MSKKNQKNQSEIEDLSSKLNLVVSENEELRASLKSLNKKRDELNLQLDKEKTIRLGFNNKVIALSKQLEYYESRNLWQRIFNIKYYEQGEQRKK